MARALLGGSLLNEISLSGQRYPAFQVLVWNPRCVTINEVAAGIPPQAPEDISPFVERITYSENIGFENGNDPTTPQIEVDFRRNPNPGKNLRRGLIEDGVIVQVRQGDLRVRKEDWIPIFTGTFRGRPGDDPGTPADRTEGFSARAFGREERYLNLEVTTKQFPQNIDLGVMAVAIAQQHMGLTQDEILIGDQGVISQHLSNQIVETPALQALWELLFPAGKKPKFDSRGRLVAVDVNLSKSAVRVYSGGNFMVKRASAEPNDVEVNNSVVITGLSHVLSRIIQETQLLTEFEVVTGFFDSEYHEDIFYSQDHSQRAQDTYLRTKKRIKWSDAEWTETDEFHGIVDIDTRFLRNARVIIFTTYLATQLAIAKLDQLMQEGGPAVANLPSGVLGFTISGLREFLYIVSQVALAGLLWAMQFVGRGRYQVHGRPFEFVYAELIARHQVVGLEPEEIREGSFRNDFISTMEGLDAQAEERLRRELVKDQLFTLILMDDLLLEVDDVLELANGDRFYIVSVQKTLQREQEPVMTLTCWQIFSARTAEIEAVQLGAEA